MSSTTLVIGGGIIGLLTARELAHAGARVTLVEMGTTGRESSWAGGGILSPLYPWRTAEPVTALVRWSQLHYSGLCTELFDTTGIDPEHTKSGMLVLDEPDPDLALAWGRHQGIAIEVLDGPALADLAPGLTHRDERVLWLPEVAHVRNPRLVKALRRAIGRTVKIHEQKKVIELLIEQGRVIGARTPTDVYRADSIVVCAGAWTASLLERLGQAPPITPVRGQMLLFHAPSDMLRQVVLVDDHYAIPRRDGSILFGSTLEQTGFDKVTTAEAKEQLRDKAVALFPPLRRTPVGNHWAGLRPSSPSGIPYIASHPTIAGLYVNAGHFRNGLTMAPASARLMADLILARQPTLPTEPYRFDASR